MTRSLVVATSSLRPITKAAKALVTMVSEQVDNLVKEGRWAPPRTGLASEKSD
jgi:LysR family nitrogen assimilation transcriptional regulator